MAISRHAERCARESALPPKADINGYGAGCPLMTRLGSRDLAYFTLSRANGATIPIPSASVSNWGRSSAILSHSTLEPT